MLSSAAGSAAGGGVGIGGQHCSSGLAVTQIKDLPRALTTSSTSGYDFLVGPLVHPRYRIREKIAEDSSIPGAEKPEERCFRPNPFTRSDLLLTSADWGSLFVGVLSRDLNLESPVQEVRRRAEERLNRELNFSAHLGLSAVLISLTKPDNSNLARLIYGYILRTSATQIWMRLPLKCKQSLVDGLKGTEKTDPWQLWSTFRSSVNHEKRLNLALEVGPDIGMENDVSILNRWLGEPVKCLIVSTELFLRNKRGYPVLPRNIQKLLRSFIPLDVQCIVEGRPRGQEMRFYQQYLDHLWQQQQSDVADPLRQFASGYEDFLQSPLQPLTDNLESGTYEVFEKDPVKYKEYQRATYQAIVDRIPETDDDRVITVMILGAGRGPLVRAALKAAQMANRRIKVFAVEKNPNAIVTLLAQKEESWGSQVTVISGDMREWEPPSPEDRADIVISELLGSFGDNELSPECLYAAQHVFKSDAISIPCSYTSFVGPLQSSKLYNEVRNSIDRDKNPHANFETPYVVHLQNRTELAPPQPLFTFSHPISKPIDNSRYDVKKFAMTFDSELHGFGGYFECTLYKDIMISINPATHSKGMFSWFPIFFPLKTPVKLAKGNEVELHFWRLNNGKQVWYEWTITKPVSLPIHNPNGRSYTIGL